MYGHFASKCPEVKRPRQQRMNQLKAQLATVSADYSAEECNTPEAIRDQLQLTVSALVSRLMQFHDNTEEDNQTEDSEPLKDEIPQQQHNVDNHNDSHSDDENSNVQEDDDDQSSVYTYTNPELSAATAASARTVHQAPCGPTC